MNHLTQRLDEKAEEILSLIIGKVNVSFYFPEAWLSVGGEGASISSVSIPVGKHSFVVIENGWSDTLEDFIDIFHLKVSLAGKPKDISVTPDENGPSGWALEHVSTINTWDWTIVNKIEIYEYSLASQHESVVCDRAILFTYEKGQILISAGGTVFDHLTINHKSDVIKAILEPMKIRKTLTASAT